MNQKFVLDTDTLLSLLFFADNEHNFCTDTQLGVFDDCRYHVYKIIIPAHCFFEVLDKIRLDRLASKQKYLNTEKAIFLLGKLLEEYDCELEVFDERCLNFLFEHSWFKDLPLSLFITQKLSEFHSALKI